MVQRILISHEPTPSIRCSRELHDFSFEQVQHYLASLVNQSDAGLKYMDTFMLLQNLGMDDFSLEMQHKALSFRHCFNLWAPAAPRLRLLALFGPGNMQTNAPLDYVLYGSDVSLDVLYLTEDNLASDALIVPDHDVAMLAMSVSSDMKPLLHQLETFIDRWPRPVLNHVPGILRCERDQLHALLQDIPGLHIPTTRRLTRAEVMALPPSFLIRPVDTHAGMGFVFIQSTQDLTEYLQQHEVDAYFVSDFVDYRDTSGVYRKNRIAFIDQKPYVCHRASADHWMISYKNAKMELSQSKRDDEQQFMESFNTQFVQRHAASLSEMARRIDLDYVVVDCAETPQGELLIFEADNAAWIHATDPDSVFPYKRAVMEQAFAAFRSMLCSAV